MNEGRTNFRIQTTFKVLIWKLIDLRNGFGLDLGFLGWLPHHTRRQTTIFQNLLFIKGLKFMTVFMIRVEL